MAKPTSDSGETPQDFYWKVYNAKKNGDAWAKDYICDSTIYNYLLVIQDPSNDTAYNRLRQLTKPYDPTTVKPIERSAGQKEQMKELFQHINEQLGKILPQKEPEKKPENEVIDDDLPF